MPKAGSASSTIVVLHGWTLEKAVTDKWQPFLKLLKKAGLTVHFWPLPGLATPPKEPLHLQNYVAWLEKKTQSLDSFILLGHSFGGQLATRFARLHPDKVAKLILIDSSGIIDHSFPKKLKRTIFKTIAKVGRTFTQSSVLRRLLYQVARESDYYQASPTQRQTLQNILTDEVKQDLPSITAPTLVIWGENDRITPLQFGETFSKAIPQAQFVIIAKARHSPIYTHPEKVLPAVTTFLQN